MKTAYAILIAVASISLAGCVLNGTPKVAATPPAPQPVAAPAPAPPPAPLSMPQTQIQLPPEQPVDPDALALAPVPEAPATAAPASRTNVRPRPRPPATPPEVEPPAAPPATVPEERGPVREVLNPAESTKLKNSADANKRTIRAWLNSSRGRKLSPSDPTVARIRLMLKASDDAELKSDMREASDWADRALVLLKELQSGR